jgi:hypothetical protein
MVTVAGESRTDRSSCRMLKSVMAPAQEYSSASRMPFGIASGFGPGPFGAAPITTTPSR